METLNKSQITVATTINAPVARVWKFWTSPEHIPQWSFASDDWHAPHAENDLRDGGKFKTTMAAKDGSMSFDFEGTYSRVIEYQAIEYTMTDGRKVSISFTGNGTTHVSESFDPEDTFPLDVQQSGWQAILDNFKKYVESAPGT
ncbi:MAG TPA: SRPBCC family protein [Sphingobacteriaceae bacterium]